MSPGRRPRVSHVTRTWAPVVASLVALLAVGGCSGSDGSSSPSPTTAPTEASDSETAVEDLDTETLLVTRGPFCDLVAETAAADALATEPADVSAYRSGQRVRISDDVADVVHEFGCRWTAGDDVAEAWVFAPPVTPRRAAALVRSARETRGCTSVPGAAGYGAPSLARSCRHDGVQEVSYRGLFGDAWLTCALTVAAGPGDAADVADRASRWCAAVAAGAGGAAGAG